MSELPPLLDGSSACELISELEDAVMLGPECSERTEDRSGVRNVIHFTPAHHTVGEIPLSMPKLRSGSFFSSVLEHRRRIDQALYAVMMEAWAKCISTRKVINGLRGRQG